MTLWLTGFAVDVFFIKSCDLLNCEDGSGVFRLPAHREGDGVLRDTSFTASEVGVGLSPPLILEARPLMLTPS